MGHFIAMIWNQLWPNIFAPSIFSILAVILSHLRRSQDNQRLHADTQANIDSSHKVLMGRIDRRHEEMKAHITGAVISTAWMKPEKPGPRD